MVIIDAKSLNITGFEDQDTLRSMSDFLEKLMSIKAIAKLKERYSIQVKKQIKAKRNHPRKPYLLCDGRNIKTELYFLNSKNLI